MRPQKRSISHASGMLCLSAEDVQRLLMPDMGAVDGRDVVAEKIAADYRQGGLSAMEAVLAEQIFRLLARDTEIRVRATLARQLKDSAELPHDIAVTMAQDAQDEVAVPMLRYSGALGEEDLIAIAHATEATIRQVAMSERREVTPDLAEVLLTAGKPEVATALVLNQGARLNEAVLEKIVARHGLDETLMGAMAQRSGLPLAVAEKVVARVSEEVAAGLRKKYRLTPEALKEEAEKARETSTLALLRQTHTVNEVERLIDQLALFERLTPSLVFTALCQGHVDFFEMSLAKLADIPIGNARTLIHDRGDLGFRAVYNKSGQPASMFAAINLLLAVVRELTEHNAPSCGEEFANRVMERLLQAAETNPVDNLPYVIALLRNAVQR